MSYGLYVQRVPSLSSEPTRLVYLPKAQWMCLLPRKGAVHPSQPLVPLVNAGSGNHFVFKVTQASSCLEALPCEVDRLSACPRPLAAQQMHLTPPISSSNDTSKNGAKDRSRLRRVNLSHSCLVAVTDPGMLVSWTIVAASKHGQPSGAGGYAPKASVPSSVRKAWTAKEPGNSLYSSPPLSSRLNLALSSFTMEAASPTCFRSDTSNTLSLFLPCLNANPWGSHPLMTADCYCKGSEELDRRFKCR